MPMRIKLRGSASQRIVMRGKQTRQAFVSKT